LLTEKPQMSRSGSGDAVLSNALVPLANTDRAAASPSPASRPAARANADFVAHLIATFAKAPQTRSRRRVEPAEAVAAYGAVGQWPTPSVRTLSRTL
jgi:hypothetical protein